MKPCPACGHQLASDGVCENLRCQLCGLSDTDPRLVLYRMDCVKKFILLMEKPASERVQ